MGDDFRSHEKLFSRDTALLDRCPQFRLRVVDLRTVEMIVAELDSSLNGLNRCTVNAASLSLKPCSASWEME